jgi:hypothetical protein
MMAAREFGNCRILSLLQPEGEKMIADFADICREFTAKGPVRLHRGPDPIGLQLTG